MCTIRSDSCSVSSTESWKIVPASATLAWRHVTVEVPVLKKTVVRLKEDVSPPNYKQAVRLVSGYAEPGKVLALMGASGAGKTSLLQVLGQRAPKDFKVHGDVYVNRFHVGGPKDTTMSLDSPKNIVLLEKEPSEWHSLARLRLPRRIPARERNARIDAVLDQLGLKKCENTCIGVPGKIKGISGGEKKRLAFATEIFTDPPILFCDEPTSGLDSWTAERIVKCMSFLSRGLTHCGELPASGETVQKTIICSIHQPSSSVFSYFDEIMLLAEGRVAFHGKPKDALNFFKKEGYPCPLTFNPADHYMSVLSLKRKDIPRSLEQMQAICDNFDSSNYGRKRSKTVEKMCSTVAYGKSELQNLKKVPVPFWWEMWALMIRSAQDARGNPTFMNKPRLFERFMMVLVTSLVFTNMAPDQPGIQALTGAMWFTVADNTFPNSNAVMNIFPRQINVFLREFRSHLYSVHSYYVSKALFMIPGFVIETITYVTILYLIADLRPGLYYFGQTLLTVLLIANTASAFGAMVSAPFQNMALPVTIANPLIYILTSFGGYFFNLNSWSPYIKWIGVISWFHYGFENLMITQFGGNRTFDCGGSFGNVTVTKQGCLSTGQEVLQKYTFDELNFNYNIVFLVSQYLGFHVWLASRHEPAEAGVGRIIPAAKHIALDFPGVECFVSGHPQQREDMSERDELLGTQRPPPDDTLCLQSAASFSSTERSSGSKKDYGSSATSTELLHFGESSSYERSLNNCEDKSRTASLTWRDITVEVPRRASEKVLNRKRNWLPFGRNSSTEFKHAIRHVSGYAKPGKVLAIMGSSGAGKTSLLQVLGQRAPKELRVQGDVFVNGINVGGPRSTTMAYLSGFLYQDDLFLGSLTVREHLSFMARIRLPTSSTSEERKARIDAVIEQMGLTKCQDTPIGIPGKLKGISGDPPILLCDEPTTGLDSWNAERIVRFMNFLAQGKTYTGETREGGHFPRKTVICTIHQPSSALMGYFEEIMLLAEGRVAFQGTSAQALDFFNGIGYPCPAKYNPADHYIAVLSVKRGDLSGSLVQIEKICDVFEDSALGERVNEELAQMSSRMSESTRVDDGLNQLQSLKRKSPPFLWEVWALLIRSAKDAKRNPIVTKPRLLQRIIMVFIVGSVFTKMASDQLGIQAITGITWMMIAQNSFPTSNAVLNLMPRQIGLFLREFRSDLYSVHSYYFSKALFLIPGFVLEGWLYASLLYLIADLRPGLIYYASTLLSLILIANTASAFGAMVSAPFRNVAIPISIINPLSTILVSFGGLFFNLSVVSQSVKMSEDIGDHETFESADSGASSTFPMQCSALRKNGFVMLKGRPCKIVEMSTSKTGKHGHAKVHLVGLDIFTNKKFEDICPSTHNMEVPVVKRNDFQLVSVSDDGYLSLVTDSGDLREDLKCPDGDLGSQLRTDFDAGKALMCTVLKACGEEVVIALKPDTSADK
ncbi:unnamed protein product [Notodromas monacha]|uniref:Eukaryotic translation initiation factor 5A n=1 Tax=Notodromas monacha TaxID=399045 RepID=A0A7R9GFG5_9CRUS|nr:unnamed protein product [Notodromas monacha]CAG0919327.1 unnamed protein product [Notodromas monacha]